MKRASNTPLDPHRYRWVKVTTTSTTDVTLRQTSSWNQTSTPSNRWWINNGSMWSDDGGAWAAINNQIMKIAVSGWQGSPNAPVAGNVSGDVDSEGTHTFAASDFSFSDDDSGDTLVSVRFATVPSSGTTNISADEVVLEW